MTRILIDVSEDSLKALNAMALEQDSSRAALVRRTLDALVKDYHHSTTQDGLALQQPLRDEW